jgi:hypothetical protein
VSFRAFLLLMGLPKTRCSGVFIGENAHGDYGPGLHLQKNALARQKLRLGCFYVYLVFDGDILLSGHTPFRSLTYPNQ